MSYAACGQVLVGDYKQPHVARVPSGPSERLLSCYKTCRDCLKEHNLVEPPRWPFVAERLAMVEERIQKLQARVEEKEKKQRENMGFH